VTLVRKRKASEPELYPALTFELAIVEFLRPLSPTPLTRPGMCFADLSPQVVTDPLKKGSMDSATGTTPGLANDENEAYDSKKKKKKKKKKTGG
jgi:hypothetical protein